MITYVGAGKTVTRPAGSAEKNVRMIHFEATKTSVGRRRGAPSAANACNSGKEEQRRRGHMSVACLRLSERK